MKDFRLDWGKTISNFESKKIIAEKVSRMALSGQIIGAGSGSTSFLTVLALGKRVEDEAIDITIVPTSIEIEFACNAMNLKSTRQIPNTIDWCFDGTDEIDRNMRLLKGRGGAMHKEKLVFQSAKKRYVVADVTKNVKSLGENFPVPVEVDFKTIEKTYRLISEIKHVKQITLRRAVNKDGPIITENSCGILDVTMNHINNELESKLLTLPGVLATGLFLGFDFERI